MPLAKRTRKMSNKVVSARDFVVEEQRNALSSYLHKVETGSSLDIRTPFWKGATRGEISEEWRRILDSNYCHKQILELEHKQLSKIGPISIQLPYSARRKDVQKYYDPVTTAHDGGLLKRAIELVSEEIGSRRSLRPLSLENAADLMQTNTNSGLPYFKKRKTVREYDLASARSGKFDDLPCVLGWRGQASGTEIPKQRIVWMFPQSVNIKEMSYFQPMFERMKEKVQYVQAWKHLDMVDVHITKLIDSNSGQLLSIDFSGFDQTIQELLRSSALNVLKNEFQTQYHKDLDRLFRISGEIPLLCPSELWYGQHGEPSGSNFTNMRDTIVNRIACQYVAERTDLNLHRDSQFQGDDGVISYSREIDVDNLAEIFQELGLVANAAKQHVAKDSVMYLQRIHLSDYRVNGQCVGVYPTFRALNSLMGMERFHQDWDEKMFIIRAIMILENCKHHPLFTKFVDFVVKGDKFALGKLLPGGLGSVFKELQRANAIPGFVSTYNAPKLSGIREFSTIKYLLSS